MSNESSASETTPLRRPERELSEDVNVINDSVATFATARNTSINHLSDPTLTTTTATVIASTNNRNNNTNNEHNTEVRLNQAFSSQSDYNISNYNNNNFSSNQNFSLNQQQNNVVDIGVNQINNNNNNSSSKSNKMDTNKRILCRVGLDVLILLCVGFPILCFFIWGDAYKRGFFCDDESLKHPFKNSTIKSWMLYIIGLVIPVGVILAVELTISQNNAKTSNGNNTSRRYVFMDYEIPDWMIECYKKIGIFAFGAGVSQLTTDIAKYSIGRLRPHFFAVCQPILPDGSTCDDSKNYGKYIQEFSCRGDYSSQRMLKEVRLSFPSGHSSFTFYTMVYLALYLQSRMTWRGSKLLRHFLQFLFIMTAWYTALSRVSDYKHHWSDVLAGSAIGSICAIVVANYVSDLFDRRPTKSYFLPRTTQDINRTVPTTINGNHQL